MIIETKHFTIDTETHTIKAKSRDCSSDDLVAEINPALAEHNLPPMIEVDDDRIYFIRKVNFMGRGVLERIGGL
jgi:hypothetical protein